MPNRTWKQTCIVHPHLTHSIDQAASVIAMSNQIPRTFPAWAALGIALLVSAAIYVPGLSGSFAFDDSTFLVSNQAIQVVHPGWVDWYAAAMSFPAGSHQGRWLGMLSFAANHYFTGMDPYWFKLTNLVIHLLNGLLLFFALRALFRLHGAVRDHHSLPQTFDGPLAAAVLAGLWLVLPINLTGVLYISQRLESLSNTFVFLGLWWYLRERLLHWQGQKGTRGMWAALVVSTGLGLLVKESAVLLPLYTACADFALTRGRDRDGRWSRPVLALYGGLLLLPLVVGLVWLVGWLGGPRTYARPFDLPERLMTESRILVQYMVWTLTPNLDSLTLYHDDIRISRGLLDPPTTLGALLFIGSLLGLALWQRAKRPLFALGILWYFGGHLLTATVIPLMLAFEHRNYFPSVGLLLAISSPIALEGPAIRARALAVGAAAVFAFYAFTTGLRSMEWSSYLQLAATDAAKRPNSSAAQYEYARALLNSTLNGDPEPMRKKAFEVLESMAMKPDSDVVHNQLLIVTSAKHGLPIKSIWWTSLIEKLRARPPRSVEASALMALLKCYDDGVCPRDVEHLHAAFAAAVDHPGGYAPLFTAYGQFALDYLGDAELAERQIRAAVAHSPSDPKAQANVVLFLIRVGRFADAELELERLRRLNTLGVLDGRISELERTIELARKGLIRSTNQVTGEKG